LIAEFVHENVIGGDTEMESPSEKSMKRKNYRRPKSKGSGRIAKRRTLRYSSLTARQKDANRRTANLISDLRRGEGPYTALRRKHHLDARTARKHAGRNLLGGIRGKPVRASKADRMVRDLKFPLPFGDVIIRTRSSRDATKLSDYYNDREKLLRGKLGAADFEAKWRGVRIAGQEVFADAPAIFEMADADVLRMANLYASLGPER
jgi:hypothetical protein